MLFGDVMGGVVSKARGASSDQNRATKRHDYVEERKYWKWKVV